MPSKKLSLMVNLYSYIIYMKNRKNILIIGSSSGIAQAIIHKLADSSYTIITANRSGEDADFKLDLTDSKSITEFENAALKNTYHWIIYCAGFIQPQESGETFTSEYGITSQLVNFTSAALIVTTLLPTVDKGGGIIALSSTAGIWGNPLYPLYSAWKGALNTFLQTLHKQINESGKYVFSICPGPTNTKLLQNLAQDAQMRQSPHVVANFIKSIIENPSNYSSAPILVIRDEKLYKLDQELTLFF